ncbi:MAG TPA: hypothetical protein VGW38_01690 [Chloroflexota bacterium]|nr:hypothetical protein [Chloroflexota bacterium]
MRSVRYGNQDEYVTVHRSIHDLALGVQRARQGGVEDSKAWWAVRSVHSYLWDIPGPLGDGLVSLAEEVAVQYHESLSNELSDLAYLGAMDAGYCSEADEADEGGGLIANDADAARWLWEPAPRIDVLMDLCRRLGVTPPDVVYHAALDGKPGGDVTG